MKHFYTTLSVIFATMWLLCGTAQTTVAQTDACGKANPSQLFKAPVKNWRLTPKQLSLPLAANTTKTTINSPKASHSGTQPTIYATIINRNSWGASPQYGIYSFTPGRYSFDLVKKDLNFNANGGASYIGDNNYLTVNSNDFGGFLWIEMNAFDTSTWNKVYNCTGDETIISTDMTYCSLDNGVYGCFNNDAQTGYVFGKFDQNTFERTAISDLDEAWIACGAAADGTIYAVTESGRLISADRQSGAISVIGNTGLRSDHTTSGTIDTNTGIFYVATCNDNGSALYTVDTTTAQASLIYDMPDGEELIGMYVTREALDPAVPGKVTDLKAVFEPNSLSGTVSFTMPANTAGGTPGTGTITYTVSAADKELARGTASYGQSVSTPITFDSAGTYDIYVTASNTAGTGPESTVTVTVTPPIETGDAVTPPYQQSFDTQSDYSTFSTIDANMDGSTWVYWANRRLALCQFNTYNPSDDYLITPPLKLEKGKQYKFSGDFSRRGAPYTESYEIVMGTAPSATMLSTVILPQQTITDDETHTSTAIITPDETGIYYVAIHCTSPTNAYGLCADNIKISAGAYSKAPAIPELIVEPDFDGTTTATVTVTAPGTDINGDPLTAIESITVTRDGNEVKTFRNPAKGQTLTFVDTPDTDGYHTYEAYATNAAGNSHSASERVYVGINYPAPPSEVKIKETPGKPGEVTMTWAAPTTDSDGNPLNPDLVTYMIGHRMDGVNLSVVARGIKDTRYTFQALDPATESQKFVTYYIFSETSRGVNDWVITGTQPIAVGNPFQMPYRETFGGETISPLITTTSHKSATWRIMDGNDQDGDGYFLMYEGFVGAIGEITTAKVAVTGDSPAFSLWYLCMDGAEDEIVVSIDEGSGFTDIGNICIGDGTPLEWTKAIVPLNDYSGKAVQIRLTYNTVAYRLGIDNICVDNVSGTDLSARAISVPYSARPGVPFEIKIYVTNNGSANPGRFTSDLYRNGIKVSSVTTDGIAPYANATVKFEDILPAMAPNPTQYVAVVNCDNDINPNDNVTAYATVDIVQHDYPAPTGLKAEKNGNMVRLNWNEPVISRENISVTDGVEDYTAFSSGLENSQLRNDNIGYWTTVDADGGICYIMLISGAYLAFPNSHSATSFIVFDAEQAGVPAKALDNWLGHNGSRQCFLAMATIDVPNDKWLISPLLSGNAQTISFFAKSPYTEYGLESFEVLYSTGGTDISEFKKIGEVLSAVPDNWTEYSYSLPAGARYFAIRSTSNDVYALLIDDISFEKAHPHQSLVLKGYRAYRDAEEITTEPLADTEHYIIELPDGSSHTYNVTALYESGESAPSNDASIDLSGIEEISAATPTVEAGTGYIGIKNAGGRPVSIHHTDGTTYYQGNVTDDVRINLTTGIYIVEIAGSNTKVLVK